jgi:hypothetical protein
MSEHRKIIKIPSSEVTFIDYREIEWLEERFLIVSANTDDTLNCMPLDGEEDESNGQEE